MEELPPNTYQQAQLTFTKKRFPRMVKLLFLWKMDIIRYMSLIRSHRRYDEREEVGDNPRMTKKG